VRSFLPPYELRQPADLGDVLALLGREPDLWRPFAGGTDLMVLLEAGALAHRKFINLWGLPELRGIEAAPDAVSIGALTTYTEVLREPLLRAEFPLLCDAAAQTGGVATQNRGTLGGNIGNASPAADTPPALLVYDAELELMSSGGARRVPYEGFHTGYKASVLAPGEIIRRIHLPRRRGWTATYRKVGTRRAQAISKVCFAAAVLTEERLVQDVRIALGSVAPTVVRARKTEGVLRGRDIDGATIAAAVDALSEDITPIDDIRSTSRYRLFVARQLLADFLASIPGGQRQ
jgi:CO/xanthine dehydrogenase FAD-binding subunit